MQPGTDDWRAIIIGAKFYVTGIFPIILQL